MFAQKVQMNHHFFLTSDLEITWTTEITECQYVVNTF